MAFDITWNAAFEADPEDTDQLSEGALRLRNLKKAIRERMEAGSINWDAIGLTDEALRLAVFTDGTKMVFQQTAAPTGWTKDTTHNDKTFRVVSGAASSGGVTAFSAVFGAAKVTGSHVLVAGELPAHTHDTGSYATASDGAHTHNVEVSLSDSGGISVAKLNDGGAGVATALNKALSAGAHTHSMSGVSGSVGSDGGHTHTLSLDLQFVDLIIATKDA